MRTVVVALLWLSTSSLALAQGAAQRSGADESNDSDTPSPERNDPGDRGVPASERARSQGTEAADGPPIDKRGDSPLRLHGGKGTVPEVHSEGRYAGVSLGGEGLPPKAPKLPLRAGPQRMTWPGFQVRDGVPTVFLQTTGAPNYTITERVGAVIVTLRGTTIKLRNNQRPLKVAEFGTDVTEISAKPHGKDVIVTINRKGDGHRDRVEPSAGGFQLLVVELPKK